MTRQLYFDVAGSDATGLVRARRAGCDAWENERVAAVTRALLFTGITGGGFVRRDPDPASAGRAHEAAVAPE